MTPPPPRRGSTSLSPKTIESHVRQIFDKLNVAEVPGSHRRVLAVLTYLRSQS